MKVYRYLLFAVILTVLMPHASSAKATLAPKAYLFGFIANFSDSVIYFTDIQEVDSIWYDNKNNFLMNRSSYSNQLRDYFTYKLNMPHRTCMVMFALTRQDAEKKFLKFRKRYTVKFAGKYEIRNLNENEFRFTPVEASPQEEEMTTSKPEKKKPKKGDKRQPRDGKTPPPPKQ